MKNAVRIHERDNVAVVIEPISKGELLSLIHIWQVCSVHL